MINQNLIPYLLLACSLLFLSGLLFMIRLSNKVKELKKRTEELETELRDALTEFNQSLESVEKQSSDQGCRIAWIESRVKRGVKDPIQLNDLTQSAPKPSITERRHRVLMLAKRGFDTGSIAATLGMPHGEIDLIIGLNRTN
jgi:hypothetical protein